MCQVAQYVYHDYAPVFVFILIDYFPPFIRTEDGALF